MTRPEIWLGDLVRAAGALRADPATTVRIRTLLGLDPVGAVADRVPEPDPVRPPVLPDLASEPSRPDAAPESARALRNTEPVPVDRTPDAPVLTITSQPPTSPPRPLGRIADVLDRVARDPVEPRATLLAPGRTRAMLTALCSRVASVGEIDVEAAADRAARAEALDPIPMRDRATTRRGLQVLVDRGQAMLPFLDDEADVLATLGRLAGSDGVRVLRFAGTPLLAPGAGHGSVPTWRPYRAPLAGTPVLVLSDLGLLGDRASRAARQAGWLRFAVRLRQARCPLVALTPVPRRRIPARLRVAVPTVTWDRDTSVRDATATARRATGHGLTVDRP